MALVRNEAVLTVSDDWQSVQRVVSLAIPKSRIISRIRYSVKLGRSDNCSAWPVRRGKPGRKKSGSPGTNHRGAKAEFYVSFPARSTFLRRFVTVR